MKAKKTHQYLRVMGDLEENIRAGKWKEGDYIPTEKEICDKYSVSRITTRRALDELQRMGYVNRQHGRGSQLISRVATVARESVCVVMNPEEHLYMPLAQRIIAGLQCRNYQVVAHTMNVVLDNPEIASRIPPNTKALIIEGAYSIEAEFALNTMRGAKFSVLVLSEAPGDERFSASINTDLFHGGYIAAKHCADSGYKRIVFFTYPIDPLQQWAISVRHHYDGMQAACREANVELLLRDIADKRQEQWSDGIAKMLKEVGKGCAVLSNMDFLASLVYRVARDLGWLIPEDLGLVGYHNTAWSMSLDMTTIDIQIDVIARQTINIVEKQKKGTVVVPPVLIVRGTTAAVSTRGDL
jgi:GntR family transcriptional regulator, arabinose operon transcriptional repressor